MSAPGCLDHALRGMIRAVSFLHSGEPALAGIPLALLPALGPRLGPGPTALAQALYIYAYCAGAAHAPLPALPGANRIVTSLPH